MSVLTEVSSEADTMKFSFLRHIPGLGQPPVRQVVATSNTAAATAAAAVLEQLLIELPELLLAMVLDTSSAQPLATYAAERAYQPAPLVGPVVAVVQQVRASQAVQGQAAEELSEIVLTLSSQLHLLALRPGSEQAVYLAVDIRDTNLGLMRQQAQQAISQLTEVN